jgi:hypothetical protein
MPEDRNDPVLVGVEQGVFGILLGPQHQIRIQYMFIKERTPMRRMLFTLAALGVVTALTSFGALAAPLAGRLQVAPSHPLLTDVDFYWHHNRYHHRHWAHGHYNYY